MDHSMKAAELFVNGHNCAQAIVVAYCDLTGLEPAFAAKMSSSFGGGMGRLREVCGAVSGMLMVAGLLYGYDDPGEKDVNKKEHYALVQELAGKFREEIGSIVCREILKKPPFRSQSHPQNRGILQSPPLRPDGGHRRQGAGRIHRRASAGKMNCSLAYDTHRTKASPV